MFQQKPMLGTEAVLRARIVFIRQLGGEARASGGR
jgi:hypothetical protein